MDLGKGIGNSYMVIQVPDLELTDSAQLGVSIPEGFMLS